MEKISKLKGSLIIICLDTLDKPARLRFSVFVKLNQNNYKYWDGNAVYVWDEEEQRNNK